ncbi:MAG: glutathione peroxidase [SAR324 cluster bacterium]|uniref:Glutathione peroxidase n=1 Tax=SAR324 cluster bacterium TaxID=2024889 RepID=A0A7X9FPW7_9DELT|nr:glutathione peroxidase [SAR324 cluster bacterium]
MIRRSLFSFIIQILCFVGFVGIACASSTDMEQSTPQSFFNLEARLIDGRLEKFSTYKGKVLLVVNTASRCGFTPQYEDLQKLFEAYKDRGFLVLAFPSNDFANQEPGSNQEIKYFCSSKFGISFPLFERNPVKGSQIQPVYKFLTQLSPEEFRGEIGWNFEKFLVDKKGQIRMRYSSFTNPLSSRLRAEVEKLISEEE